MTTMLQPAVATGTTTAPPVKKKRTRLVTLDLMRGYYVGVLAAIHLNYVPSLLGLVDGRGELLVSEAEGFFMISGLLVGMLRRRDLERYGIVKMTLSSWKRAAQLYIVAVPLTLLFTFIARTALGHGHTQVKGSLDQRSDWPHLLENSLNLSYTYGWADFLTYYVPMFLVAPAIVWLLSRKLWPVVLVLAYFGYWETTHINTGYYRPFLQWGVYFFIGAAAGYHWDDLRGLMARLSPSWRRRLRGGLMCAAIVLYAIGLLFLFKRGLIAHSATYTDLFGDNRLGVLRPLAAPISVAGTYFLVRKFEKPLARTIGKVIIPFGRSSLYVYVAQSFVVFLTPLVFGRQGFLLNTLYDFAIMALIWVGVRVRFLAFLIPRA
ncbi:OpgC domain-containing protein [Actinospica robiniae]|uniref:OpgC domain-containing protein n=1 Tax=Actinospica robiniae TaxID=304901 RepID=UPI00054F6C22|nr:OpgC domain-containing protein [Actinospica robiniae]